MAFRYFCRIRRYKITNAPKGKPIEGTEFKERLIADQTDTLQKRHTSTYE